MELPELEAFECKGLVDEVLDVASVGGGGSQGGSASSLEM